MSVIVGYDTERDEDAGLAEAMLADVCHAYPGHGWFVVIRGGIVHVKDMDINPNWGMALHYNQISGDALERRKKLVRAAGEYLERANLRRGAKDETKVVHVEGMPDKHLARTGL